MSGLIHLPNRATPQEMAEPQAVKLTRDIMPQEALKMIADQQAKIFRLLTLFKQQDEMVDLAQAKQRKATQVAARLAAQNKKLQEQNLATIKLAAADVNQLKDRIEMMGVIICCLIDKIDEPDTVQETGNAWIHRSRYERHEDKELTVSFPIDMQFKTDDDCVHLSYKKRDASTCSG